MCSKTGVARRLLSSRSPSDVAKKNPKAKGTKAEDYINIALLKELDQNGFIDTLYKK